MKTLWVIGLVVSLMPLDRRGSAADEGGLEDALGPAKSIVNGMQSRGIAITAESEDLKRDSKAGPGGEEAESGSLADATIRALQKPLPETIICNSPNDPKNTITISERVLKECQAGASSVKDEAERTLVFCNQFKSKLCYYPSRSSSPSCFPGLGLFHGDDGSISCRWYGVDKNGRMVNF